MFLLNNFFSIINRINNCYVCVMFKNNFSSKIFDLPQYKISSLNLNEIKRACVKILDVKDLGKLNDRFEGQQFLENKIKLIGGHLAALDFLKEKTIPITHEFIKNYKPIIKTVSETYVVVSFANNSYPIIRITDFKKPRIFVMEINDSKFCVFGIGTTEILNNKLNYDLTSSNNLVFKALDKLTIQHNI
jgi:hypothetical protein